MGLPGRQLVGIARPPECDLRRLRLPVRPQPESAFADPSAETDPPRASSPPPLAARLRSGLAFCQPDVSNSFGSSPHRRTSCRRTSVRVRFEWSRRSVGSPPGSLRWATLHRAVCQFQLWARDLL